MARHCSICIREERPAIDAALLAEEPYRNISARFGTSLGALSRHHTNHLLERWTAAPRNQALCLTDTDFLSRLPDGSIDVWWASPPYNLADELRGGGGRAAGQYRYANGHGRGDGLLMPEDRYQDWQVRILTEWHRTLTDAGVAFYSHKNRHKAGELLSPYRWIARTPLVVLGEVVWDRGGTPNVDIRRFLPVSERIYILARHPKRKLANVARWRDVLDWDDVVRVSPQARSRARTNHPAPAHPEVVRRCLSVAPPRADGRRPLVADCYGGVGTTALVARDLEMDYLIADHAAEYVQAAQRRLAWPVQTGPLSTGAGA